MASWPAPDVEVLLAGPGAETHSEPGIRCESERACGSEAPDDDVDVALAERVDGRRSGRR